MRFAVCDDQPLYLKEISARIAQFLQQQDVRCELDRFETTQSLLDACQEHCYDAIFLDVEMPHLSGLAAAAQLRASYPHIHIIFVSAHLDYAPQGYTVSAFRYLLKEQLDYTFLPCMEALWQTMHPTENTLILRSNGQQVVLNLDQVAYFEASRHSVCAHFQSPCQEPLRCTISLGDLRTKLEHSTFHMVQRSFIVNFIHVKRFYNYTVVLKNGQTIPVSKPSFAALRQEFLIWKGVTL